VGFLVDRVDEALGGVETVCGDAPSDGQDVRLGSGA